MASKPQAFEELYDKYYSTHYKHLKLEAGFRKKYWEHRMAKLLPKSLDATILDLGCGNSDLLLFLHSLGYSKISGVDLSAEMIAHSLQLLPDADLSTGDVIEFIKTKNAKYDLIFANHLLEHLPKDVVIELFKYLKHALKPAGRFIMMTPNFASPFGMRMAFGDFTHVTPFSATALSQLASMSGLSLVYAGGNGPVPYGWKGALKNILWKLILEPLGKLLFAQGSNAHGSVVAPELLGVFQRID